MQYPSANSPPLHHPVPQHPVHFQQGGYGNPAGAAQSGGASRQPQAYRNPYAPPQGIQQTAPQAQPSTIQPQGVPNMIPNVPTALNSILSDPNAQLGFEVGRNALNYGQEYIGRNMGKYMDAGAFSYYFQVSNFYVFRKLLLVMFPWRHKPWSRQIVRSDSTGQDTYATPREDLNAPDMYIPIMAFTTYMVVFSIIQGLLGQFHPQLLGIVTSKSLALMVVEISFLKLFSYLLAASSSLLDLIAYSGYKFIAITLVTLAAATSSSLVKWTTFTYTGAATAFFMLRSLRYVLLPESSNSTSTVNSGMRQKRIQFLFIYSFVCQFVFMWLLL